MFWIGLVGVLLCTKVASGLTAPSAFSVSYSIIDATTVGLRMSWLDNSNDETEFEVLVSAGGAYEQYARTSADSTVAIFGQSADFVPAGTQLYFLVRAVKGAELSGTSNVSSFYWPNASAGPFSFVAPTITSASFVNSTTLRLLWTDGSNQEQGFEIEARDATLPGSPFQLVTVVNFNLTQTDLSSSLQAGISYEMRMRARRLNGTAYVYSAYSNVVGFTTPGAVGSASPPAAPINLTAAANIASTIYSYGLFWDDKSPDDNGFEVQEKVTGAPETSWVSLGVLGAPAGTSDGLGLNVQNGYTAGISRDFRVRAVRGVGPFAYYSAFSNVSTATEAVFDAPAEVRLTAPADNGLVQLFWSDNATTEEGIDIEYRVGGAGGFVSIGTLSTTSFSRYQTGGGIGVFRPSTQVEFRLRAYKGGASRVYTSYSNEASVVTPALTAPNNLVATATSDGNINLTWADNSGNETYYEVQRKLAADPDSAYAAIFYTSVNATSQAVPSAPETGYAFRVRAGNQPDQFSSVINSTFSNSASATTPALSAPTGLLVEAGSLTDTQFILRWTDNSSREQGYDILYRPAGSSGAPVYLLESAANATSATVPLSPGASVEFFVRAFYLRTVPAPSTFLFSANSSGITVTAKDGFTSHPFITATFGQSVNHQLVTTTTIARNSWSVTGLPAGLSFDSGTGVISGALTVSGLFNVVLGASFADGWNASGQLVLRIAAPQVAPVIAGSFSNIALVPGGASTASISGKFSDPDTQSAVRMSTTKGNVDIILYSTLTPVTTANFLGYMTRGDYNNSVFNRISTLADSGVAVLQGGQLKVGTAPIGFTSIATQPAIQNEAGISNVPYTIAMAKQGGNPNSATSQFYFNLDPANTTLDSAAQNGGFTVFGRVSLPTRSTINALKGFPGGTGNPAPNDNYQITINGQAQTSPFKWPMNVNSQAEVPTTMDNTKVMVINSVSAIPSSGLITYSASSDNAGVATAIVNGGSVDISALGVGSATITVTATDLDGAATSQTFSVVVDLAATAAATAVTSGWATLNGTANPAGQPSTAYFEYGQTTAYGTATYSNSIGDGTAPVPVSFNIAGLSKGTQYHYRLVVVSGGITHYGADQTFTTPSVTSPPAWHSSQLTAVPNAAPGSRTGAAHSSSFLYYYKGADNNMWGSYWNGSQWAQAQLTSDANVDDWLSYGTTYGLLCYKGIDNKLWALYYDGSAWATAVLGGTQNVAGDVVMDTAWNLIYYRGTDARVWVVYWTGTQWAQTSLAGATPVVGNLAVDEINHLVYFQGGSGQMWCYYWSGTAWLQTQLSTASNVGGAVAADTAGGRAYYRSSADSSLWCVYWNGSAWVSTQLDAAAGIGAAYAVAPLAPNVALYLKSTGQCAAEYWSGTVWGNVVLGDGGSGLTGGLSVQRSTNLTFARRADGQVVIFYFQ